MTKTYAVTNKHRQWWDKREGAFEFAPFTSRHELGKLQAHAIAERTGGRVVTICIEDSEGPCCYQLSA